MSFDLIAPESELTMEGAVMHTEEDEPAVIEYLASPPVVPGRARRPDVIRYEQPPNSTSGVIKVRDAKEDWKHIQQLIKHLSKLLDSAEDYRDQMLTIPPARQIDFNYWIGVDGVVYYYNDETETPYPRVWWPRKFTLRKTLQGAPPEWERGYVINLLEKAAHHSSLR